MSDRQYIFHFTTFMCGCVYHTAIDKMIFCPEHRRQRYSGTIWSQQTILQPTPDLPDIPGIVMDSHRANRPAITYNTSSNSLHTSISVRDGSGNFWRDSEADHVGICPACFTEDSDHYVETGIAMCECGEERCSYRWCGQTSGLHAYWRLHVLGVAEQTTDVPDEDIFSYGTFDEQSPHVTRALDAERQDLTARVKALMLDMDTVRRKEPVERSREDPRLIYLMPWLDEEYRLMNEPAQSPNQYQQLKARNMLESKIARLHIIGALPPIHPLPPDLTHTSNLEPAVERP